jgi:fructose-bisphosphate aldolase class II
MLKDVPDPSLDVPRVEHIAEAAGVPLVLHGASGNSDADIAACIAVGVRIVHINTEIRVAYRDGIRDALTKDPEEVAPYKYLGAGAERLKEVAKNRALLFTGKRTV